MKVTAKVIEDPESTAAAEDLIHWLEGEEDISQVEADPSELMDQPRKTGIDFEVWAFARG